MGAFNDYELRGQKEVVGGSKMSTFRVKNVHVEVGGGQKKPKFDNPLFVYLRVLYVLMPQDSKY